MSIIEESSFKNKSFHNTEKDFILFISNSDNNNIDGQKAELAIVTGFCSKKVREQEYKQESVAFLGGCWKSALKYLNMEYRIIASGNLLKFKEPSFAALVSFEYEVMRASH